jgi:methylphosphotriester-DNA--protein-cysteine methyltransferase
VNRLQELARAGVRYQGVKTTKIFCYPTCHTGRHALEKNIVWLQDEASARAMGFRPCKVCRPAAVA